MRQLLLQRIMVFEVSLARKKEHILDIPPFDMLVLPYLLAKAINRDIVLLCEVVYPIIRPLFIHMICASLKGNRGGKEHHWTQTCQGLDKDLRTCYGDVFSHFQ